MILALDGGAWVLYSLRSTRLHVDLSGVLAGATSESEPCVALLTAIAQPMAGVVISGGVQSIRPEGCSSTFPSWQGLSADHQPILGANCIRLPLTSELNCITHPVLHASKTFNSIAPELLHPFSTGLVGPSEVLASEQLLGVLHFPVQ